MFENGESEMLSPFCVRQCGGSGVQRRLQRLRKLVQPYWKRHRAKSASPREIRGLGIRARGREEQHLRSHQRGSVIGFLLARAIVLAIEEQQVRTDARDRHANALIAARLRRLMPREIDQGAHQRLDERFFRDHQDRARNGCHSRLRCWEERPYQLTQSVVHEPGAEQEVCPQGVDALVRGFGGVANSLG